MSLRSNCGFANAVPDGSIPRKGARCPSLPGGDPCQRGVRRNGFGVGSRFSGGDGLHELGIESEGFRAGARGRRHRRCPPRRKPGGRQASEVWQRVSAR